MKRREFIALAGGVAASLGYPIPSHPQNRPAKIPRIGIIDDGPLWEHFRRGMRDFGFIEGQTIAYEYRASGGKPARLAAAAAELAALHVDLIATYGTPPSQAAKAATSTIPIVAISIGDPVRAGLVQNLAHPGSNVTGNTIISPELSPKRLQLIKEIIPAAKRVALLWNPENVSNTVIFEQLRDAARTQGLSFAAVEARNAGVLPAAYDALARERPDAVLLTSDPLHQSQIHSTVEFLIRNRLPAMCQTRDDTVAGCLVSYGASFRDMFWQGAFFAQKILRGTKPADLPVQTPQRFELVINLKTAKAIGLTISEAVQLRADAVIE